MGKRTVPQQTKDQTDTQEKSRIQDEAAGLSRNQMRCEAAGQSRNQTRCGAVGQKRSRTRNRAVIYFLGILILACGITLNTKTGWGVSPLVVVSYSVSEIWNLNFAAMTFMLYTCFVIIAICLKLVFHLCEGRHVWMDLLQIPFSLVFSLLLNVYDNCLPDAQTICAKVIVLALANVLTAIGAAMTVAMRLVPNPADGLSQTIGMAAGRGMGFGKNVLDIVCVSCALLLGFLCAGHLMGVGIGTVVSMIATGRCIALFNHFFREKLQTAAGVSD